MNLIAAGGIAGLLPVLLVLACPLMMIFMMRGMHGGGHGHAGHDATARGRSCHGGDASADAEKPSRATMSLDELKRERDELNALIGERAEQAVESNR